MMMINWLDSFVMNIHTVPFVDFMQCATAAQFRHSLLSQWHAFISSLKWPMFSPRRMHRCVVD